jgi:mono/diheme cytochrome c family protein
MKKISVIILLLFVLSILIQTGCSSPAPAPAPTPTVDVHAGKVLTESRCSTCHGLNMIEASKKDQKGWEATVERMILAGAQLDDEQAKQVIDYLAVTYSK